jgi:hypothetical protein
MKAKQSTARRRKYEGQAPSRPPADPADELTWREVRALLDEEIVRLPEIYRSVFVLCCLENVSREETARRLGLKDGTVSSRLAEARKRLQLRLSRRGVELTALLAATALTTEAASALPAALLTKTIEGTVSPAAAALASSASSIFGAGKIKLATAFLLTASVLTGGLLAHQVFEAKRPAPQAAQKSDTRPAAPQKNEREKPKEMPVDSLEVHGVVGGPDGKPIAGAKVYGGNTKAGMIRQAVTDQEGRYRLTLRRENVDPKGNYADPWEWTPVAVVAEGYGLAWRELRERGQDNRLDLNLVADDAPIEGRILDLEGRPVAGANVRVLRLHAPADDEDLSNFLKQWTVDPHRAVTGYSRTLGMGLLGMRLFPPISWHRLWWVYRTGLFPPTRTDKDGKFRLTGLGRERLVELLISAPNIEETELQVVTRKNIDAKVLGKPGPTLYGATFEHAAGPTKPIVGVVRDKTSGKPLAGIRIVGHSPSAKVGRFWPLDIETVTDAKGVYRLTGLPKDREYSLNVADLEGANYLPWGKDQLDTAGLEPLKIDFELERGVRIEGRLLDKANGKPVPGRVHYAPLPSNPRIAGQQREAFRRFFLDDHVVGKDGGFKFVAYPGPGIVYAEAATGEYLPISFALADKKLGLSVEAVSFTVGGWDVKIKGHSYRLIDPDADTKSLKCDLTFEAIAPKK